MTRVYFPESSRSTTGSADLLIRAAIATARSKRIGGQTPEQIAKEMWPGDRDVVGVTRSTTQATTTTGVGADLAVTALSDLLISGLGPSSASGAVFSRATQLRFVENSILIPGIAPQAANVSFIGEGSPIPVVQFDLSNVSTISRKKLSAIFAFTNEMLRSSYAESLARAVITESLNLAIDSVLFGASFATSIQPAGLRAGVTATAAASAGANAQQTDLAALSGAVASVSQQHVFISDAQTAAKCAYGPATANPVPIFASNAVPAKMLICCGVSALVLVTGAPTLETASDGTVIMDSAAAAFATGGTIAASSDIRSLWQADSAAVRLTADVVWGLRASSAVQWINSVNW
jgi:hypothetical protein